MYSCPRSLLYLHLSCFCMLLTQIAFVDGRVYCSARSYGSPDSADCSAALLNLPMDTDYQWFVEQQLRTALPTADWRPFADDRPPANRRLIVQLPKWWSHRSCNIALVMYGYQHLVVPVAFLRWSDIRNVGYQLAGNCVDHYRQGGAAELFSGASGSREVMALIMRRDGAPFDNTMNSYMSAPFPMGMDPARISTLLSNSSLAPALEMTNTILIMTGLATEDGTSEDGVAIA